jgi:SM-20-related protein
MESVFDRIADDLASQGYAIADQFMSQNEVRDVLSLKEFSNKLKKAGIGKEHQVNEAIRGDYIHWLDKNTAPQEILVYFNRVDQLMSYLNRALFLSLKDYEIHMTVYPVGAYYKRHLDQFRKDDHRKLSIICYLNEDWQESDGGQLRIYLPDGSIDVLPLAGRLVCFRSDQLEHEVLPAKRERKSLTGWILDTAI